MFALFLSAGGLLLVFFGNQCEAELLNTCAKVEPCLVYKEFPCDQWGKRQVCVTLSDTPGCVLVDQSDGVQIACVANDISTVRKSIADIAENAFFQNVPLCDQEVRGGNFVSFGIRDGTMLPTGTLPRPVTILGNHFPVNCSEYTNICDVGGNNDIELTFRTGICPTPTPAINLTTTTRTTTARKCSCSGMINEGTCTGSCDGGLQRQFEICFGDHCDERSGTTFNTVPCIPAKCHPVDGGWANFSPYSVCSVTCGRGTKQRRRACNKPLTSNGGRDCVGSAVETLVCDGPICENSDSDNASSRKTRRGRKRRRRRKGRRRNSPNRRRRTRRRRKEDVAPDTSAK